MDKKILIVEDEPLIAQDLCFILQDIGLNAIQQAHSYEDAVEQLTEKSFDLVLLDINLSSEKDGIDLAQLINARFKIPFIFITSYYNSSTVSRAKITRPLAYLLKPFNQHDIRINVEMALYKSEQSEDDSSVYLKEKTGTIQLKLASIIKLEAQDNYTKIITEETEVLASQTLKSVLENLPDRDFVRTHKSFAVRLDKITMIKGSNVFLDQNKVPIGRTYKSDLQKRIAII